MVPRAVRAFLLVVLGAFIPASAAAQLSSQPTPRPGVTAENEPWYLSGTSIALGGAVYHPSGPVMHFLANEMVPTGVFDRVQVYRRTTQEPGSIVYVPLPGGLVRPYERRRDGDLAGTVGSTTPSFPIVRPFEELNTTRIEPVVAPDTGGTSTPQPVGTGGFAYGTSAPVGMDGTTTFAEAAPAPVGTTGIDRAPAAFLAVRTGPTRIETAQRPVGLNTVFLEFQNVRYYAAGRAVEFSSGRFERVGDQRGIAVYKEASRPDTIYVAVLPAATEPGLLVPYRARP